MFSNPLLSDSEEANRILERLNNKELYIKNTEEYQRMKLLIQSNERLATLLEIEDLSKLHHVEVPPSEV